MNDYDNEAGMALLIVVMVILVVTLLSVGLVSQAIGELPLTREPQDRQAALQAAQAGVEDYLADLNANASYFLVAANNTTGWVPLPGPASSNQESFRYSADTSDTLSGGTVTITSSGCATGKLVTGTWTCTGVIQTVRVSLQRSGFLDDVYFTDYEVEDPALVGGQGCTPFHQWDTGTNTCPGIEFAGGDTLNGPVH